MTYGNILQPLKNKSSYRTFTKVVKKMVIGLRIKYEYPVTYAAHLLIARLVVKKFHDHISVIINIRISDFFCIN